jgi:hypothetical protein
MSETKIETIKFEGKEYTLTTTIFHDDVPEMINPPIKKKKRTITLKQIDRVLRTIFEHVYLPQNINTLTIDFEHWTLIMMDWGGMHLQCNSPMGVSNKHCTRDTIKEISTRYDNIDDFKFELEESILTNV